MASKPRTAICHFRLCNVWRMKKGEGAGYSPFNAVKITSNLVGVAPEHIKISMWWMGDKMRICHTHGIWIWIKLITDFDLIWGCTTECGRQKVFQFRYYNYGQQKRWASNKIESGAIPFDEFYLLHAMNYSQCAIKTTVDNSDRARIKTFIPIFLLHFSLSLSLSRSMALCLIRSYAVDLSVARSVSTLAHFLAAHTSNE